MLKMRGVWGWAAGGTKPPCITASRPHPHKGRIRLGCTILTLSGHRPQLLSAETVFYLQHVYTKKQAQAVKDTPKQQGRGLSPIQRKRRPPLRAAGGVTGRCTGNL